MQVRDISKLIEADGWYLVVTKGSHRQYKHPHKPGESPLLDIQAMTWHPEH